MFILCNSWVLTKMLQAAPEGLPAKAIAIKCANMYETDYLPLGPTAATVAWLWCRNPVTKLEARSKKS